MDLFWLLLVPLIPGAFLIGGIVVVKSLAQASRDGSRQHYIVTFPRDTKFEAVMNLMTSMSGLITRPVQRMSGLLTCGLEVEADARGIRHRLILPAGKPAEYMVGQVRQYGFHIEREDLKEAEHWDEVVEFRLRGEAPLRMDNPEDVVSSLLASLGPLKDDEAVLLQWLVAPARQMPHDDNDALYKQKNAFPLFRAIGRVAVRGETAKDTKRLIWRVAAALKSVETRGARFKQRIVVHDFLHRRVVLRTGNLNFPCLLNAKELAALSTLPAGDPRIPGLPQGRSRHLPADSRIPEIGFTIARSDFPGAERALAVSLEDRMKHMHFVGPTGSGKSVAMAHVILQEIDNGYGTVVIEPGTDLINDILDRIPPERIKDVIVFDPTDASMPIGFNILAGSNPYLVTQQVMAVLDGVWDVYKLPRTSDVLRAGILTLAQRGLTLMDLSVLLEATERGKDFRYETLRNINDAALKNFWHEFDSMKPSNQLEMTAPVTRRLRQLEYWPSLRATLGQKKSGFELKDVIARNKILLVPLNQVLIGEETAPLIGAMLVSKLWQEIQSRSAVPAEERKPFFCHIDEAQNFLHMPVSIRQVLAEARKYGLGLTLAHQDLGQLPPQMRDGIMSNARTKMIFAPASADASAWSRELSPHLDAHEFQNLGRYQVVVRVAVGGEMAPPATGTTYAPAKPLGSARAVREASRAAYGRPLAEVEAELHGRHKLTFEPKPKPNIGREEKS